MTTRVGEDLKFKVTVGGQDKTYDLGKAVEIDENNLSPEFSQQPSLQAWWGTLAENAQHALRQEEADFEVFEATLANKIRETAAEMNPPVKMSEAKIVEMVKSDLAYTSRLARINNAKHQAELLKVAIRAIESKASMLISLGAQKRSEMEMTNIKINEKYGAR
jgi:hypothetical protein